MFNIRATYLPCENMFFDRNYYTTHHLPLAEKHLAGIVTYDSMHAEFDVALLLGDRRVLARVSMSCDFQQLQM